MKIAVVSAPHMILAPRILGPLLREKNTDISALVLIEPKRGKLALAVIRRAGLRYFLIKTLDQLYTRAERRIRRDHDSLESIAGRYGIEVIKTSNVNSKETRARIAAHEPEVLLSVFAPQIFKKPLIEIPSLACLNLHPSLLPRYAGIAPVFWCLVNGENETGVTLHHISRKVDQGDVFLQTKVAISAEDTVRTLYTRVCEVGSRLLLDAHRMLTAGEIPRVAQDLSIKSYFGNPDREAYRELRKKGRKLF